MPDRPRFHHRAWRLANGQLHGTIHAPPGLRWLRLTDVPVAVGEIAGGRLSVRSYLQMLTSPHERTVAALNDPFPSLVEVPMVALARARRLLGRP